jgi:hypothetical protein
MLWSKASALRSHILRLCRKEHVAFFFKQWGGVRKGTTGRRLNNRTYDEMPLPQTHPVPSRQARASAANEWDKRAKRWDRSTLTQIETELQEVAV